MEWTNSDGVVITMPDQGEVTRGVTSDVRLSWWCIAHDEWVVQEGACFHGRYNPPDCELRPCYIRVLDET